MRTALPLRSCRRTKWQPPRLGATLLALSQLAAAQPASGAEAVALSVGSGHACVITASGGAQCWGDNEYGQLGDGTTANRSTPVDVVGLTSGVAAIAAGSNHTCALVAGGGVKCWGRNSEGQVGDGTGVNRSAPVDVAGLTSGVAAISARGGYACVVTTAGAVKCWGFNFSGQVGIPVAEDDRVWSVWQPVDVPGLESGIATVVAGTLHGCALTTAGGVKCWGSNENGQLGFGDKYYYPEPRVPAFDVVGMESGVASLALGTSHTCAVMAGGGAKCWGDNWRGQLGDGTETERTLPTDVVGLESGVRAMAAGSHHTCALTTAGAVQCWGGNDDGQLGDGTRTRRTVKRAVNGLTAGVAAISAYFLNTCALTTAGEVKCWGPNQHGQLGEGNALARSELTAGCVVGLGDSDGDRICDADDPCAGRRRLARGPGSRLQLRRVNTDPTPDDEALLLQGFFGLPADKSFADLDPLNEGARVVLVTPGGAAADIPLPAGAYGGSGSAGWVAGAGGDSWRFLDSTGSPGAAIKTRLTIRDGVAGAHAPIELRAVLRKTNVPISASDVPVQAIVVIGDEAAGSAGLCVQSNFRPGACAFDPSGSSLECRWKART